MLNYTQCYVGFLLSNTVIKVAHYYVTRTKHIEATFKQIDQHLISQYNINTV